MPILKSAKKALRSAKRKRAVNLKIKKNLKEVLRNFKKNPTAKKLSLVFRVLDKAAKKKVIAKNKASRLKSRLSKRVKKAVKTPPKDLKK